MGGGDSLVGTFRVIPKEIKEQILYRIKNEGVTVTEAAKQHGVSPKTVWNWLGKQTSNNPGIVAVNHLQRENKALLELVGKLTLELTAHKKKNNH